MGSGMMLLCKFLRPLLFECGRGGREGANRWEMEVEGTRV